MDDASKQERAARPTENRQPLRQLSQAQQVQAHPFEGRPPLYIRPSSVGELVEERDWIHPVPPPKPDFGVVLDEEGNLPTIPDRRKQQIEDLSYCVNVTAADSTFEYCAEEGPVDTENILAQLDFGDS